MGARGSTEEENSAPKRPNMADSCEEELDIDDVTVSNPSEPSLMEINEMLVDIQITVATILRENKQLKEDLLELKSALNANQRETESLKTQLLEAKKANSILQNELKRTRNILHEQREETNRLDDIYDELEQYSRKNSLEILGIPENAYTSTEEAVIRLGEALNVHHINSEDIEISHKLKRKNSRPIIVKFLSHKVKSRLYKARIQLKGLKVTDIFSSNGNASPEQRIFINENLTDYRRELFWKANKKKKDNMIISAWTIDGKLFVKTSPDGAPIRIYEEGDLENI